MPRRRRRRVAREPSTGREATGSAVVSDPAIRVGHASEGRATWRVAAPFRGTIAYELARGAGADLRRPAPRRRRARRRHASDVHALRRGAGVAAASEDDESGGGGNDRISDRPKRLPPSGGIPLPDADQSPTRFRGPGRLSDTRPGRGRRATPEPHRSPSARRRAARGTGSSRGRPTARRCTPACGRTSRTP
jgi:hypothetical protein